MADTVIKTSSGISAISLLGVAFIVLKLCGVITWSWWWVLAPFWVPPLIGLAVILLIIFTAYKSLIPDFG